MFYEVKIKSHIRVPPSAFSETAKESILKRLKEKYENHISPELGAVIAVSGIDKVGEGVIIAGDGAAYYDTSYKLFIFKPEMQEIILGKIIDITEYGAFIEMGPLDGMIHVSQTMDDFVNVNKQGTLSGKESKKVLKKGDICRSRIIAVSYKDITNPKIGLTMRQHMLGSLNWIEDELKKGKKKKWQKKHVKNVKS